MTRKKFIEAYRAQQRHGNVWGILWLVMFFGVLIGFAVYGKKLEALPWAIQM